MQQLNVVNRLFPKILSGEKTSTIRWGDKVEVGYLNYVCDGDSSKTVKVWVIKCTNVPLSEAAALVGKETEWTDQVMLEGMREHYPKIQLTDTVQVVEHLSPAETQQREQSEASALEISEQSETKH